MTTDDEVGEVTRLLQEIRLGNRQAEESLVPLVYDELHRIAKQYLRRERRDHTLQTTALVNEAYLRLTGTGVLTCVDRNHFFAIAARIMRRILVDYAKTRMAGKRGGGAAKVALDDVQIGMEKNWDHILAVNEALSRLAAIHPRAARVVEMRFFTGLQIEEIAEVEGIAGRTVKRDLDFAQSWLYGDLCPSQQKDRMRVSSPGLKSRISK
jgi:RNA polymerase sigma factor (TIGR02999 family)